jgi:hypothetical protein
METPRLPPDLERLERDLAGRPRPEPSPKLRDRVMRDVRAELEHAVVASAERVETERVRRQRSGWMTFAAGLALSVLVWLNLSLSAAQATSYEWHRRAGPRSVDVTARQIRKLLPELSPQEARRHALIVQVGSELVECPSVVGRPATPDRMSALDDLF